MRRLFFSRAMAAAMLSSLLVIGLFAGCAPAEISLRRIVYGLTLQPSGFDPHIHASSELTIPLRSVYDTLVYRNPDSGAFTAGLAQTWEMSSDGLNYTFGLRQGVTFHDGTTFDAAAVAANLDRITDPATGSQKAIFMLGSYEGYEIVDAQTIRLSLSAPYAPLLDSLSQTYLGIASPTAFRQYTNDTYQFHQVGTGPFTFVDYIPGDHILLRRNFDYTWGPDFYGGVPANSVDEVEFRFFTDPTTRAIALESGDAQVMGELLPLDARALSADSAYEVLPVAIPGQPLQFIMNTSQFPTDDVRVRRALLYATNREAIADTVFAQFSPVAWAPLAAVTDGYAADLRDSYLYDSIGAASLLTQAGFTDSDNSGTLDFTGANVTLRIIVPPWGLIPQVVQLLQAQWRTIGFETELITVPSRSTLFEAIDTGGYNLVAWYDFGKDPGFLARYFTSTGASAWTGYQSADLDSLFIQEEQATDPAARAGLIDQAQRIIMDQALILPIRDYVNLNVARGVTGLRYDAQGWSPLLWNLAFPLPLD